MEPLTLSGFAFVAYETPEEAQKALNERLGTDGGELIGRIIAHGSTLSIHLSKRDVGYKPTPGICLCCMSLSYLVMGKQSYREHRPSSSFDALS